MADQDKQDLIAEQNEKIISLLEEVIEKLDNLSKPGGAYGFEDDDED